MNHLRTLAAAVRDGCVDNFAERSRTTHCLHLYEDQLFRLVISYDPARTDGLTDDDMIEALSAMYGLDALAQTASAEAVRLDELEAPQREVDRRSKEADETRTAQEKARLANKATFKP